MTPGMTDIRNDHRFSSVAMQCLVAMHQKRLYDN